jgi:hypothetical protein
MQIGAKFYFEWNFKLFTNRERIVESKTEVYKSKIIGIISVERSKTGESIKVFSGQFEMINQFNIG